METRRTEMIKAVIIEDLRDIREGLATLLDFTSQGFVSSEEHLRKTAASFKIRSRRQGFAAQDH